MLCTKNATQSLTPNPDTDNSSRLGRQPFKGYKLKLALEVESKPEQRHRANWCDKPHRTRACLMNEIICRSIYWRPMQGYNRVIPKSETWLEQLG